MSIFFNELTLNISPVTSEYDIISQSTPHTKIDLKYLNPELTMLLEPLGIKVIFIECFKRLPKDNSGIHSDWYPGANLTKINWIYQGKNSFMNWYNVNEINSGVHIKTIIDTPYTLFSPCEVTLAERVLTKDKKMYLLDASKPHQITNPTETRYCVSAVLGDADNNHISMRDAQRALQSWCGVRELNP